VADFTEKFTELEDTLKQDRGLIGRLEAVAGLARRTIPNCDGAGLAIIAKGRAWSAAISDDVVLEVDLVQYDTGEGPCLDAMREGRVVRLDVYDSAETYPHFAPGAIAAGIRSVASIPTSWNEQVVGALNLYSERANAFPEQDLFYAEHLAAYAAESIVTSPLYAISVEVVEEVIETLGAAEMIGQALGIMSVRGKYTRADALEDLATAARLRGESLREAAEWVIREQHLAEDAGDGERRTSEGDAQA
jgi:GAF domain-containing protein